tara:strand:+ start:185 stop:655 length:471 start_codon:yes stop_codon:yes gene_type:complete
VNNEIERRFLVNKDSFILPQNYKSISQAYLIFDDNQVLRVRNTNDKYQITYKFKKSNIHRLEFEYDIPSDDGEKLLLLSKYHIIKKDRYYIDVGLHTWEIDIFKDLNKGLVIAEIELSDENEKIEFPNWIDKEISNDNKYLNFNLSQNPYSFWKEL